MSMPNFDMPAEIAPGEWKRLGDCTADDLRGAQAISEEKAKTELEAADVPDEAQP